MRTIDELGVPRGPIFMAAAMFAMFAMFLILVGFDVITDGSLYALIGIPRLPYRTDALKIIDIPLTVCYAIMRLSSR